MEQKTNVNETNIIQYLSNRMSDGEKENFFNALEQDTDFRREFIKQKNLWAVSTSFGKGTSSNYEAEYFLYKLKSKKEEGSNIKRLNVSLNIFKTVAAVLLVALLGSVALLLQKNIITGTDEVFYTETYVPKGEKSEITLPDGTHLFINADSRVKIPSDFSLSNRKLKLEGEAYFNVKHSPENPFLVETESINIEVLGTCFDLSCYPDDEMVTTMLDEGSIRFVGANNNRVNGTFLKPGETAYYHKSSGLFKIRQTENDKDLAAWKEGRFKFKDMPFYALASKIERLYNVEIIVEESLKYQKYTGEINEETVWEVMNSFALATPFDVEASGRKIIIKSKKNFK